MLPLWCQCGCRTGLTLLQKIGEMVENDRARARRHQPREPLVPIVCRVVDVRRVVAGKSVDRIGILTLRFVIANIRLQVRASLGLLWDTSNLE